jgi:hypothetical protein
MLKKIIYLTFFIFIALCLGYFFNIFFKKSTPDNKNQVEIISKKEAEPVQEDSQVIIESNSSVTNISAQQEATSTPPIKKTEQQVPFIVQAPFGNWKDSNFQNACEEASVVMAMGWIKDEKNISAIESKERILAIIDFENKTFGYSTDTNAFDIEKIFKQYFKYEKAKAQENIVLNDIKLEIQKGNIIIIPAFGQALNNPNFTFPGPVAHMLVIIGYDPLAKQFITNDPGTKNGAGYRYDENILFDAIWEYPSGKTDPPMPSSGKMKKAMIIVSK